MVPKLKMFTTHDAVAGSFIHPFFLPNTAMAERAFTQAVNDPSHEFSRSPADYTLYEIGEFDPNSGTIETAEKRAVANGAAVKRELQNVSN